MPYKDEEKNKRCRQQYYQDNKEEARTRLNERRLKNRQYVAAIKEQSKCERCGESHPATLHFHHINSDVKDTAISKAVINFGLKRLKIEVAKCEILCANCHAKHHYHENDKWWTENR